MATQLSNPTVTINNVVVAVSSNSVMYTEGLGEQSVRSASAGGNQSEQVFSENIETQFSTVKFDMPSTIENIANARDWKIKKNGNLIQITGRTPEGDLSRTFTQAALLNDVEVALGTDNNISLEFKSNPAI